MEPSPYHRANAKGLVSKQGPTYWRVVDGGEVDGMVGVFEDYLDASLEPTENESEVVYIMLFFPVSRRDQEEHDMTDVTEFLGGQVAYLRENNCRLYFETKLNPPVLEEVNPEDL